MVGVSALIFIIGLAIGSFLNVCIYRIPRERLSINSPRRSICPKCETQLRAYDNIPVLSYILLRGRCRHCNAKISITYPLVELTTGGLFLLMSYRFGLTLDLLHACTFVALLVPIACIDARWYIIPNSIIITGLILGLVITLAISFTEQDWRYLLDHLFGAIAGVGVMMLIVVLGGIALGKKAMGIGDVKLMALIMLFLGLWPDLLVVVALSAMVGTIVGSLLIILGRKGRLQFSIPLKFRSDLDRCKISDSLRGEFVAKSETALSQNSVVSVKTRGSSWLITDKDNRENYSIRKTEEQLNIHSPKSMIPYGPFLATAALLNLLWGETIWDGYMKLIGWY